MAGRIKLSPAELRTSAERYAHGSQEVEQVLNQLTQEQSVIRDNWEGSAFESFDSQFSELSPKIRQFSGLLQQIRDQLHKVAEIVEQTDADIASQING